MAKLRRLVRLLTTALHFASFMTQAALISEPVLRTNDSSWMEMPFGNTSNLSGEVMTCGDEGTAYFAGGDAHWFFGSLAPKVNDVPVPAVSHIVIYSSIALILLSYLWKSCKGRKEGIDTGFRRLGVEQSVVMHEYDYTVMATPNATILAMKLRRPCRQRETMPRDSLVPSFSKISKRSRKRDTLRRWRKDVLLPDENRYERKAGLPSEASLHMAWKCLRANAAAEQLNDTGYFSDRAGGSSESKKCNKSPCSNCATLRASTSNPTCISVAPVKSINSLLIAPNIRKEQGSSPANVDTALKNIEPASEVCDLGPAKNRHIADTPKSVDEHMQCDDRRNSFGSSKLSPGSAESGLGELFNEYRKSAVHRHDSDTGSLGDIEMDKIMASPRSKYVPPASTDSCCPDAKASKPANMLKNSRGRSEGYLDTDVANVPIESGRSDVEIGSGDAPELCGIAGYRGQFVKTTSEALPIAPRPYDPNEEHFFQMPSFISLPKASYYTESNGPSPYTACKSHDMNNKKGNSRMSENDLDMELSPGIPVTCDRGISEDTSQVDVCPSMRSDHNTSPKPTAALQSSDAVINNVRQPAKSVSQEPISGALKLVPDGNDLPTRSANDNQHTGDGVESKRTDPVLLCADMKILKPEESSEQILSVSQLRKELSAIADRERKVTEHKIAEAKESAMKDLYKERNTALSEIKKKQVDTNRAIRQKFDDCLRTRKEALQELRVQREIIVRETGKVREYHTEWSDTSDRVEKERRSRERHQYNAGLERIRQYEKSIVTCVLKAMSLRKVFQGTPSDQSTEEPRCYDCCIGKHPGSLNAQTKTFRKVFHDDLEPRKPPVLLREGDGFPSSCPIVQTVNSQYQALNLTAYVPMEEKIARISKMQKRLQWDLFRRPFLNHGRLSV